jgi:NTP pyrophosphatase (non-canonical NTP hydrolase)
VSPRDAIFQEISAERARQDMLKAEGRFEFTCADPESSDWYALAVLTEEVGEAARAVLGKHGKVLDGGDLRKELIQVAAVAVAWIEGLDHPHRETWGLEA